MVCHNMIFETVQDLGGLATPWTVEEGVKYGYTRNLHGSIEQYCLSVWSVENIPHHYNFVHNTVTNGWCLWNIANLNVIYF